MDAFTESEIEYGICIYVLCTPSKLEWCKQNMFMLSRKEQRRLPACLCLLLDGNSCALWGSKNYCCRAVSDSYDYTRAAHVLEISTDDGLIELHVWWKYECRITAVGRGLFLCPSVKKRESYLATAARLFLVVGVEVWASFPSTGDGKCTHKLFYSRIAGIPNNGGSRPVFHYPLVFQHFLGLKVKSENESAPSEQISGY